MLSGIRSDVISVKKLAGIDKVKKITLIVAPSWKYKLFKELKKQLAKTFNPGEILKAVMATELKKHGKDITKIIPAVVKDTSKMPSAVLVQKTEMKAIQESADFLKGEFKAGIEVVAAEDSKEAKAKNALPGKPAILIS